jgi:hypothetical protein
MPSGSLFDFPLTPAWEDKPVFSLFWLNIKGFALQVGDAFSTSGYIFGRSDTIDKSLKSRKKSSYFLRSSELRVLNLLPSATNLLIEV